MEDTLMIPRESLISQFNCKFVALASGFVSFEYIPVFIVHSCPSAVLEQNLTTLLWLQEDIQHNITAISFENASVRPDIADRVNGQSLFYVVRRG